MSHASIMSKTEIYHDNKDCEERNAYTWYQEIYICTYTFLTQVNEWVVWCSSNPGNEYYFTDNFYVKWEHFSVN